MKQYITYDVKTSKIINDLKSQGFKFVDDPMMYESAAINSLVELINEHKMIAIIRKETSVEISIPEIELEVPSYFIFTTGEVDQTSNDRYLAGVVLESLRRGRVQNTGLLLDLAEDADDATGPTPNIEEIILMEKK